MTGVFDDADDGRTLSQMLATDPWQYVSKLLGMLQLEQKTTQTLLGMLQSEQKPAPRNDFGVDRLVQTEFTPRELSNLREKTL